MTAGKTASSASSRDKPSAFGCRSASVAEPNHTSLMSGPATKHVTAAMSHSQCVTDLQITTCTTMPKSSGFELLHVIARGDPEDQSKEEEANRGENRNDTEGASCQGWECWVFDPLRRGRACEPVRRSQPPMIARASAPGRPGVGERIESSSQPRRKIGGEMTEDGRNRMSSRPMPRCLPHRRSLRGVPVCGRPSGVRRYCDTCRHLLSRRRRAFGADMVAARAALHEQWDAEGGASSVQVHQREVDSQRWREERRMGAPSPRGRVKRCSRRRSREPQEG
jgi:hypothetical protein